MPGTTVAVIILGLAVGAEFNAAAYITARDFGADRFGAFFGTIMAVLTLIAGFGPSLHFAMSQP